MNDISFDTGLYSEIQVYKSIYSHSSHTSIFSLHRILYKEQFSFYFSSLALFKTLEIPPKAISLATFHDTRSLDTLSL